MPPRSFTLTGLLFIPFLVCAAQKPPAYDRLTQYQHGRNLDYELIAEGGHRVGIHCGEFSWEKIAIRAGKDKIPGFFIRCRKKISPDKLVIWVHGGPWAFARTDLEVEQLAFLDSGYDIFVPFYPGSSDRPFKLIGSPTKSNVSATSTELASGTGTRPTAVTPDVVDAMSELKSTYDWGTRNYKVVDVVGESFGAFLTASTVSRFDRKSSLFLINPNLSGESFLEHLYASKGKKLEINGSSAASNPEAARILNDLYFKKLTNYNPLKVLRSAISIKIKLIYGGADSLLVAGEIEAIKALANAKCGIDYRPQNGHEFGFTQQHFEDTVRLIRCSIALPDAEQIQMTPKQPR